VSKQNSNTAIDILTASVLGATVAMIITMFVCAIGASMMAAERAGEGSAGIISVIALISSSTVGAVIACRKAGHHRLAVCLGAGITYLLILFACTATFFDGEYQAVGTTALAVLGGSSCAALLGLREKQPRSRYSKYHNSKVVQNRQIGN